MPNYGTNECVCDIKPKRKTCDSNFKLCNIMEYLPWKIFDYIAVKRKIYCRSFFLFIFKNKYTFQFVFIKRRSTLNDFGGGGRT
jgi:hypothetical protein